MNQRITRHKTKPRTFSVQAGKNSPMELDFKPLVDRYGLEGTDAVLLHWQAFPKKTYPSQENYRIFGAYDVGMDAYHSFESEQWETIIAPVELVQLDESLFFTKPVACLLFRDCRLKVSGQLYTLETTDNLREVPQSIVSREPSPHRHQIASGQPVSVEIA